MHTTSFLEFEGPHLNVRGVRVEPSRIVIARVWMVAVSSKYKSVSALNRRAMAEVEGKGS